MWRHSFRTTPLPRPPPPLAEGHLPEKRKCREPVTTRQSSECCARPHDVTNWHSLRQTLTVCIASSPAGRTRTLLFAVYGHLPYPTFSRTNSLPETTRRRRRPNADILRDLPKMKILLKIKKTENEHAGYLCPEECSHQLTFFFYAISFKS